MIALYNYMSQILVELIKMANLIITISKSLACANRVAAVLELKSDQKPGTLDASGLKGEVEFRDVAAQYSGASNPSLEHISFHAMPGQTIGIIGGTGSGKTTLVNLIPRLYDALSGQVLLDGVEVNRYDPETLRKAVGLVPRKRCCSRVPSGRTCAGAIPTPPTTSCGRRWKPPRPGKW